MAQLGRVLVPNAGVRVVQTSDGEIHLYADASWLPFVVEELVALGAARVVLPVGSGEHLPPALRRWVANTRVDDITETVEKFLLPVTLAIGVSVGDDGSQDYTTAPDAAASDLVSVDLALDTWLAGHRHKCHVSIDVAEALRSSRRLRKRCQPGSDASVRLAAFEGLLRGYSVGAFPALIVREGAEGEAADLFNELLDDATYRELSQHAFALGWRAKVDWAARRMGRLTRAIIRRPAFRGILGVGNRVVSTVTGADLATHEDLSLVLSGAYSPPLVQVSKPVSAALRRWARANPPMIEPSGKTAGIARVWPASATPTKTLKQIFVPAKG